MATSREQSQFGRRRSNTAQSSFRAIPPTSAMAPLNLGDSKVLNAWVHDVKDSPAVIFNQSWWPGVAEGDLLKVLSSNADHPESAFLFMVPKDEGCPKPQLQVCFFFHKQCSEPTLLPFCLRYRFLDQLQMFLVCETMVKSPLRRLASFRLTKAPSQCCTGR